MSCERRKSATGFSPTETAHVANPTPNDRAEATGEMLNAFGSICLGPCERIFHHGFKPCACALLCRQSNAFRAALIAHLGSTYVISGFFLPRSQGPRQHTLKCLHEVAHAIPSESGSTAGNQTLLSRAWESASQFTELSSSPVGEDRKHPSGYSSTTGP